MQGECNGKVGKLCFHNFDTAEPKLILFKDNANERNESLLSNSRVQLILCKDNANERNESLLSNSRVQLILCKVTHNPPLCRYNIMDMVYISSSGLSRCSFISLNCVGDSPVCALNCALRCATLE